MITNTALSKKVTEEVKTGFFQKYFGSMNQIGIILQNIQSTQKMFFAFMKISHYNQSNYKNDIAIYVSGRRSKSGNRRCAIFSTTNLPNFSGNLIATEVSVLPYLANNYSQSKNKFFYIYDIYDLIHYKQNSPDAFLNIKSIIEKNNIKLFTRSEDYRRIILNYLGLSCLDTIVPDFQIEKIVEITESNYEN